MNFAQKVVKSGQRVWSLLKVKILSEENKLLRKTIKLSMKKTLSFRVKEEVMKLQGFKSLPHRWIAHTRTLLEQPNIGPKKKFDLSIKLTSDQIITWQAPATQPPPQGKINIGTMDVSDDVFDVSDDVFKVGFENTDHSKLNSGGKRSWSK